MVRTPEYRNLTVLAAQAREWLLWDYFGNSLEWGYRGIPRRLMAEQLLRDAGDGVPLEMQVFTFSGKAAVIRVLTGEKGTSQRHRGEDR